MNTINKNDEKKDEENVCKKITTKDFLFDISDRVFVSGHESDCGQVLIDYFSKYTDSFDRDNLGSYIFKSNGSICSNNSDDSDIPKTKKIMMASHIDEIGLMVTDVLKGGFLSFTGVGGVNPSSLVAQDVIVHGKENLIGVIGLKPPHITSKEEMKKAPTMDELFIDIGMSKEKAQDFVTIGDVVTIDRKAVDLAGSCVSNKSLDNRAGVAVMYEVAKELDKIGHKSEMYYAATVQEEVGLRGAKVASYKVNPDIAIIVDVTFGKTPGMPSAINELGDGGSICYGSSLNQKLTKKLVEVAKEYNYKFQYEIAVGSSGTDATAIQVARMGVPCLMVSIPLRYMHTSVEVIDMEDVMSIGKLIARFVNEIDYTDLEDILCF